MSQLDTMGKLDAARHLVEEAQLLIRARGQENHIINVILELLAQEVTRYSHPSVGDYSGS